MIQRLALLAIVILYPITSYPNSNGDTQDGLGLKKQADAYDLVSAGDKNIYLNNAAIYHIGYISGAYDTLINARLICRVGTANKGQIVKVINDYVRKNTDKLSMQASDILYLAFSSAFPCK
ncbi:Rap1a/Tai family immunity protein [Methylomonas sp. UP202]|uniref:Rap1a/Tai family immunity protein n=1 Tax=Methylomonas sp. UP202 TaxID=3040943 RepID=UPI00247B0A41|nr:Rap1a/Tai family immunity protein [Methylomonas sp. UP202]WGS85829.1 Rap1a/Tai family immunity protein [Methylomonas sp. UP202]